MEFPKGRLNLFMIEIGEPEENTLRVVVAEAELGELTNLDVGGTEIENVRPMEIGANSRTFEFYWDSYVAYAVRNESYWDKEKGEPDFTGHFGIRTNSAFLAYVAATTFAGDQYPGSLQHWSLDTLSHCIAVVGTESPRISRLDITDGFLHPTTTRNYSKN